MKSNDKNPLDHVLIDANSNIVQIYDAEEIHKQILNHTRYVINSHCQCLPNNLLLLS